MIPVPTKHADILVLANELIEQCRVSVGMRSSMYRQLNALTETGRYDGTKSLINMLFMHLTRLAAHLFSPVELKFSIDFENPQPRKFQEMGHQVGKSVTRDWERSSTDLVFGRGVFEALKYGAAILKQWTELEGEDQIPVYQRKLVMPWGFGVYREDENDIDKQEALCETITLTLPEVWRRIYHLPGADKLFAKIKTHAKHGEANGDPGNFFHQVLSTSQLNTGVQGMTQPVPGGIVQLNNDPNYSVMGPVIAADVVQMHELWVKDEKDYTTIQLIEPDILIAPLHKKANLLISDSMMQPYRLIQPNEVTNWFWGRSELVDLVEPQGLLSSWCDDFRRLVGLQIDKILAFKGENTIGDELYAQFRGAGFVNLGAGGGVEDLTPKIPSELIPAIQFMIETINSLGGFENIMRGQGESGVRAGNHANQLLKMASPSLRDRALLVERQCATCADLTLSLKEAKDHRKYWTKADEPLKDVEETSFLLTDLPQDWRVTVDSHSSSPIFADENAQLIFALRKSGDVDGEYAIDNLPLPNKEAAKTALHEKAKKEEALQQQILKSDPELGQKILEKKMLGGGHHR